jgi:hypothetical protein
LVACDAEGGTGALALIDCFAPLAAAANPLTAIPFATDSTIGLRASSRTTSSVMAGIDSELDGCPIGAA